MPVPAGPMPKTMSLSRIAWMYRFCASPLGVMIRWREETNTVSPKISLQRDALPGELRRLVDVLQVERIAVLDEPVQLAHEPFRQLYPRLLRRRDHDLAAAQPELDAEAPLDELQMLAVRAAERANLVVVREIEPCRLQRFRRGLTQATPPGPRV